MALPFCYSTCGVLLATVLMLVSVLACRWGCLGTGLFILAATHACTEMQQGLGDGWHASFMLHQTSLHQLL